jgi:hypothetical protein
MNGLLRDIKTLRSILLAFQKLVSYYVASRDPHAMEALARLRQGSRGRDTFFASLSQDLNATCLFCEQIDSPKMWETGDREDVGALLRCLAETVDSRRGKCTQNLCTICRSRSGAQKVKAFEQYTSDWNYEGLTLDTDQQAWLKQHLSLHNLATAQRQEIRKRSSAAAQLLQRVSERYHDGSEMTQAGVWALGKAVSLCEPLENVRKALFQGWTCECVRPDKHLSVLASFSIPCQCTGMDPHGLLRFTTDLDKRRPWSTVTLNVTDGDANEQSLGSVQQRPMNTDAEVFVARADNKNTAPLHLHDCLIRWSKQQPATAKLRFCLDSRECVLTSEGGNSLARYSMIPLESLLAQDSSDAIRNRPLTERLTLALLIAHAFLELGNSPWFPYMTEKINVWLYQAVDDQPILLQPYMEVSLEDVDDSLESQSDDLAYLRMINRAMPCLPMLGKLILELIDGRPIAKLATLEQSMKTYRNQRPLEAPYVLGAVEVCISDPQFKEGSIYDSEILRKRFLEQVISRLHSLLAECNTTFEAEIKDAHSRTCLLTRPTRKRRRSSVTAPQFAKRHHLLTNGCGPETLTNSKSNELMRCYRDDGSLHTVDTEQ